MCRWVRWGLRVRAEIEVKAKVRSRVRTQHRSRGMAWPGNKVKVKVPHRVGVGITAWIKVARGPIGPTPMCCRGGRGGWWRAG